MSEGWRAIEKDGVMEGGREIRREWGRVKRME